MIGINQVKSNPDYSINQEFITKMLAAIAAVASPCAPISNFTCNFLTFDACLSVLLPFLSFNCNNHQK